NGHGHAGGAHAGGHTGGHEVGHAGHHAAGHHSHSEGQGAGWSWTSLLSPRLLFSLMVGFGAIGLAATPLGEPLRAGVALAGAAAFEAFIVGPLWRFLFRFESK